MSALHVMVHMHRFRGSRRVTQVSDVVGLQGDEIVLADIFAIDYAAGFGTDGRFQGELWPPAPSPPSPPTWPTSASRSPRSSSRRPTPRPPEALVSAPSRFAGGSGLALALALTLALVTQGATPAAAQDPPPPASC